MSDNIIAYQVVYSNTPANLTTEVAKFLAEGWELYGSPFYGNSYVQAMVRRDNSNDPTIAMLATAFQSLADFHTKQSQE